MGLSSVFRGRASAHPKFYPPLSNNMNNNNNNNKSGKKQKSSAAQQRKQLRAEILNEIRSAAGQPAKGKGRGKRNRQQKKHQQQGVSAAYATGQSGQGAKISATREMCRVSHREFIGNVTGSVAFAIAAAFAINPGLAASFPWLSGIAQNWETYRFRKLRLCYYTRTGSNVPGSVLLAHDPDASDAAPATEQVMTTYEKCEEDAPWKDICMELSILGLNDLGPRKFIRSGALAANQDIKLYDSGNAFVGTVDGTAVAWGKLWFEYDVDFYTPQLPPAGLGSAGVTTNALGTGVASATPLGTVASQTITGQQIVSTTTSTATVSMVVGREYQATYGYTSTTSTLGSPLFTPTGMTLKTSLNNPGAAGSGGVQNTMSATFTATAVSGTLLPNVTLGGTITNVYFSFVEIPVSAL